MDPLILKPNPSYRSKLYLVVGLLGMLATALSVLLGRGIGYDDAGTQGATVGTLWALGINALWLLPALALISPYYKSLRYEIHVDEVIVHGGVITRSVKHVPYRTVTNLKTSQTPLDRLFSIGALSIQTAGMSGQSGAEEKLVGLTDFVEVYETVAATLRRFRGPLSPVQAGEESPADEQVLGAILSELKHIRSILEQSS